MHYRIMYVRTLITGRASRARSSFNALCLSLSSSDRKPRVKFIKNATGSLWDDTSEEKVEAFVRPSRHSLLRLESFHPRIFRSERINRRQREKAARAATRADERYRARERGKGKEDRSCSPEVSYL